MMKKVVIIDGVRTPFGRMGGGMKTYFPSELMGLAIKGLLEKTGVNQRACVDSVMLGTALHDAHCNNVSRFASLYAGLPYETSAAFIEMQCGSGIACINAAARSIMTGDKDIVIAGGGESYSQRFAKFSMAVEPYKLIPPTAMVNDLSPVKDDAINMIQISDLMAQKWSVSREDCDAFACESQRRAANAVQAGYFDEEIIPVVTQVRKGPDIVCNKDEHLRPTTTIEGLSALRPVNVGGVTTAGNASGRNDGAAVVLMMSEDKAQELGYVPMATWIDGCDVGVDPKVMGIGPAYSNMNLMKRNGLRIRDIDIFECNEAFAAQNLAVIAEMEKQSGEKINRENWNPNGGAIAFGHPNGASGGRIAIFAMKELMRREARLAIFGSCCGGGLGVSTLIERYQA